jgi:hypothetical protein
MNNFDKHILRSNFHYIVKVLADSLLKTVLLLNEKRRTYLERRFLVLTNLIIYVYINFIVFKDN